MGGAFTAVADDATAPYWNPAGMVYLPYREVLPQHQEKFGSLANHDYIGGVWPLGGPKGRNAALGVGLVRFAVDDIPITPRPGALRPGIDFLDYGPDNDPTTPDPGQADGIWEPGREAAAQPGRSLHGQQQRPGGAALLRAAARRALVLRREPQVRAPEHPRHAARRARHLVRRRDSTPA